MNRPKGRLLKKTPYTLSKDPNCESYHIKIAAIANDIKPGKKYYQEDLDNGIILLIPEDIYKND